MFLGWYDDTPKKSEKEKIEEAVERYRAKFGAEPNLCLVNAANAISYSGLEIRPVQYVRPNHFWVGRDETSTEAPQPAQAA